MTDSTTASTSSQATFHATDWIWRDGTFVPWPEAKLHVMSHVVHYGSSVFEGIRCYATPNGPALFRLTDHLERFLASARIYRMEIPHSMSTLKSACHELFRRNDITRGYLRPIAFRGYGTAGLDPTPSPIETFLICWPWGAYLGADGVEEGVDVCVSSWTRPAPNTLPTLAKAGGNYLSSQLVKMEAVANGFADAIVLGPNHLVSEGSAQNVFLVRRDILYTPPVDGSMLDGITRDSVLKLAETLGVDCRESPIPRERLYTADELFFTGTASEVTPIRSVDRIPVGAGKVGPVTRMLQAELLGIARGTKPDPFG